MFDGIVHDSRPICAPKDLHTCIGKLSDEYNWTA